MAATVTAAPRVGVRLRVVDKPTTDQLHDLSRTTAAAHDLGVGLPLDLAPEAGAAGVNAQQDAATLLGDPDRAGLGRMSAIVTPATDSYSLAGVLALHVDRAPAPCAASARARPEAEPQRVRTFWSPSGRQWTAEVYELPRGVGVRTAREIIAAKAVVRFTSAALTLDLYNFPADWASRSDDELIDLLRRANPPAFAPLAIDAKNQM